MIQIHTETDRAILHPESDQDVGAAAPLHAAVNDVVERGYATILVDLGSVTNLSSSAIGSLIAAHNLLRQKDGHLVIRRANPELRYLFGLMGLDRHFEFEEGV